LAEKLDWWRGHLAGASATLSLPSDRPRPAVPSWRGGQVPVRLGGELSRRLSALGHAHGATPFMVLHAGFAALLSRFAGQDDVTRGTPMSNRTRLETEGLIGFFVNPLPLRLELHGRPSFVELIERARVASLEASLHQDLPFERLVEELQPERALSR